MRKRIRLNVYERGIIQILEDANRPLTTQEISDYGSMNWATAKKYLQKLLKKGFVSKEEEGNAFYWSLIDTAI